MLFLITWKIYDDKKLDCFRIFMNMNEEAIANEHASTIKIVGRWHDLGSGSGVCVAETDDSSALSAWMVSWAGLCDIKVRPVTDDNTSREILKSKLSE
jgi:hypothetical protein